MISAVMAWTGYWIGIGVEGFVILIAGVLLALMLTGVLFKWLADAKEKSAARAAERAVKREAEAAARAEAEAAAAEAAEEEAFAEEVEAEEAPEKYTNRGEENRGRCAKRNGGKPAARRALRKKKPQKTEASAERKQGEGENINGAHDSVHDTRLTDVEADAEQKYFDKLGSVPNPTRAIYLSRIYSVKITKKTL